MDKNSFERIKACVDNPVLRQMLDAIEKGARAQARAEYLAAMVDRQERAVAKGILTPLPDDFFVGIKAEKLKAEGEAKAAQKDALKALTMMEVEKRAKAAGAVTESIVALAMGDSAKADFDKHGNLVFIVADNAEGKPKYNPGTGEPYTIGEYINQMKQSEEHGFLFADGKKATAQGRANPWKKESYNLTQQARIIRESPALAAQMKAEAGQQ